MKLISGVLVLLASAFWVYTLYLFLMAIASSRLDLWLVAFGSVLVTGAIMLLLARLEERGNL